MIVTSEKFLNGGAFELFLILKHGFGISVLPLGVSVFGIEVVLCAGRNKGSGDFLLVKRVPVVTPEPLVLFNTLRSVQTESARWLSLD